MTISSILLLTPKTKKAKDWIEHNVQYESYQRYSKGIMIEHRFIEDIIEALLHGGFLPARDFVVVS